MKLLSSTGRIRQFTCRIHAIILYQKCAHHQHSQDRGCGPLRRILHVNMESGRPYSAMPPSIHTWACFSMRTEISSMPVRVASARHVGPSSHDFILQCPIHSALVVAMADEDWSFLFFSLFQSAVCQLSANPGPAAASNPTALCIIWCEVRAPSADAAAKNAAIVCAVGK